VEGFNFDARKHVVEYDDVMNKQREIVYGLRRRVLNNEITDSELITKLTTQLKNVVNIYAPRGIVESEVLPIVTALVEVVPFDDKSKTDLENEFKRLGTASEIGTLISKIITDAITQRRKQVDMDTWKQIVKFSYLSAIDNLWIDHLDAIDDLRSGIGLRGYGQRDPLVEYKGEAFSMFERLVVQIESEFSKRLFRIQVGRGPATPMEEMRPIEIKADTSAIDMAASRLPPQSAPAPPSDFMSAFSGLQKAGAINKTKSLGRNDPCPCGSGKKWKKCHYPN